MYCVLTKELMDTYNTKEVFKKVKALAEKYGDIMFLVSCGTNLISSIPTDQNSFISSNRTSDKTSAEASILVEYRSFIEKYNQTLSKAKETFTDDEKILFEYSIEKSEKDSVIQNIISKYDKNYYKIKKSCYLKIYLCFNLNDKNSYFSKMLKR